MSEGRPVVRKASLPWRLAGLLLGVVQVVAVAVHRSLGVSTESGVAGATALNNAAPDYVRGQTGRLRRRHENRDDGGRPWAPEPKTLKEKGDRHACAAILR